MVMLRKFRRIESKFALTFFGAIVGVAGLIIAIYAVFIGDDNGPQVHLRDKH